MVTVEPKVIFSVSTGSMVQTQEGFYNKITLYPLNNTIRFNITSLEPSQHGSPPISKFTITTTGTMYVVFDTNIVNPIVQCSCTVFLTASGNMPEIRLTFTPGISNSPLVIIWRNNPINEPGSQKVLFIDDFLYTNPLLSSLWQMDTYSGGTTGSYTASGFLIMKATNKSQETNHVIQSSFIPSISGYFNGTAVKRKLTVALFPFTKSENPATGSVRVGMGPLLPTGAYPGNAPAGTPYMSNSGPCIGGTSAIGSDVIYINNVGLVVMETCGDGSFNSVVLSTINPALYTVLTVETFGIYCSTCTDNVYMGTSWVWFRIYQRDSNGVLIGSTDQNQNFTSNVAPLYQASYVFVNQNNGNAAATGQVSKIDIVQLQNYGSPVCLGLVAPLIVPGGFLCTRLPPIPGGFGSGIIGDFAYLAFLIGFGDEQIGALILFMIFSGGFSFIPLIFTRNYLVAGEGEMLVLGFFVYAGFLPSWVIFLPILFGTVLTVMLVNRMIGGHGMLGFGGGSE